jgi:hypothetical protein
MTTNYDSAHFPVGQPVITPAAQAALKAAGMSAALLLARHVQADWGEVGTEDRLQNELALLLGMRLFSRYMLRGGGMVWIITEADRSVTTIMLPDDY